MGLGEKSDGNGVWILCWYGVDGMKESHFKSLRTDPHNRSSLECLICGACNDSAPLVRMLQQFQ